MALAILQAEILPLVDSGEVNGNECPNARPDKLLDTLAMAPGVSGMGNLKGPAQAGPGEGRSAAIIATLATVSREKMCSWRRNRTRFTKIRPSLQARIKAGLYILAGLDAGNHAQHVRCEKPAYLIALAQVIVSGAGHDAIYLARVAATGMIFVPCERGISHNEVENAKPEDLAAGCNVLLNVILEKAGVADCIATEHVTALRLPCDTGPSQNLAGARILQVAENPFFKQGTDFPARPGHFRFADKPGKS